VIYSGINIILFFASCAQTEPWKAEFTLGTVCSVTLYEQGHSKNYDSVFSRIIEIENLMSLNISESDVNRINAAAGSEPVQVHEDVFRVIERAVFFAEMSNGAFDPTVGPLVSLWGISGDYPRVPSHEEIVDVLQFINWRDIELNESTRSVYLKRSGMALDLGAIAKGYAASEAAAVLIENKVKRAVIDLGGDIVIFGETRERRPWRVGIQNPVGNHGSYMGVLQLSAKDGEKSVVTSGVYERFFVKDGQRYHHIFSPSQGYPASNGLLSVTIITSNAMDADALSTAVFVMGYERGLTLINRLPGVEAIFIFEDNSVYTTPGLNFTITDNAYFIRS